LPHKTKAVAKKDTDVKVQLIYAFNSTGKTRLSREFKDLIMPNNTNLAQRNILYYNAFTEDLFYWDNDLQLIEFFGITLTFLSDIKRFNNLI
jgi:hypothetical protein